MAQKHRVVTFRLNCDTDKDIIQYLDSAQNVSETIKNALRNDIGQKTDPIEVHFYPVINGKKMDYDVQVYSEYELKRLVKERKEEYRVIASEGTEITATCEARQYGELIYMEKLI